MKKTRSVPAAIEYYLTRRRQLGFELRSEGWLLTHFAP